MTTEIEEYYNVKDYLRNLLMNFTINNLNNLTKFRDKNQRTGKGAERHLDLTTGRVRQ